MSLEQEKDLDKEVSSFFEQEDLRYGKNSNGSSNQVESTPPKTSLGTAKSIQIAEDSSISGANDGYCKNVPFENLPSG